MITCYVFYLKLTSIDTYQFKQHIIYYNMYYLIIKCIVSPNNLKYDNNTSIQKQDYLTIMVIGETISDHPKSMQSMVRSKSIEMSMTRVTFPVLLLDVCVFPVL